VDGVGLVVREVDELHGGGSTGGRWISSGAGIAGFHNQVSLRAWSMNKCEDRMRR
jgi:hypothetical protein